MTTQNISRKYNNSLHNPSDAGIWASKKKRNTIKIILTKTTTSAQNCPKAPKRPYIKNHHEATVKVHIARTLCTLARARNLFQVKSRKKHMSRDHLQSVSLSGHDFDFRSGFAIGFESNTKTQPEAQNSPSECTIQTLSMFL